MKKKYYVLGILVLAILIPIIYFFSFDVPKEYVACGCGCCGGIEPKESCLYHSNGDNMRIIIFNDKLQANNPSCPNMGCSFPTKYVYCD